MQQIKAAIRRDQFFPRTTQPPAALRKFFETDDFCAHALLNGELCVKPAKRRGKVPKTTRDRFFERSTPGRKKSAVGLLSILANLWKMKVRQTFHISRKPVVPL